MLGLTTTQGPAGQLRVRQLVVGQETILRIPVQPRLPIRRIVWEARKGPKCVSLQSIRGASLSGADHVDFLLVGRQRVRARFSEDCPALDFYGDFYLKPQGDRICAGRDVIHSRIGGSCRIERFQHLVPKVKE